MAGLLLVVIWVLGASELRASEQKYLWESRLPARLQWLQNDGYCGEVSLIMALMRSSDNRYAALAKAQDPADGAKKNQ